MDDAFGAIVYISKEKGHIDPGPAFTVHLEVDYKSPVPAGNVICCITEISRIEGRKIFGSATVAVRPDISDPAFGEDGTYQRDCAWSALRALCQSACMHVHLSSLGRCSCCYLNLQEQNARLADKKAIRTDCALSQHALVHQSLQVCT